MSRKPLSELTDAQILAAADRHDSRAEDFDAYMDDEFDTRADYHATRASELRAYVAGRRATPTAQSKPAASVPAWMTPDGMDVMTADEKADMLAATSTEDAAYAARHDVALVRAASVPAAEPVAANGALIVRGVSRDTESPRSLYVSFDRKPTDDELRRVHGILATSAPAAPAEDTIAVDVVLRAEDALGLLLAYFDEYERTDVTPDWLAKQAATIRRALNAALAAARTPAVPAHEAGLASEAAKGALLPAVAWRREHHGYDAISSKPGRPRKDWKPLVDGQLAQSRIDALMRVLSSRDIASDAQAVAEVVQIRKSGEIDLTWRASPTDAAERGISPGALLYTFAPQHSLSRSSEFEGLAKFLRHEAAMEDMIDDRAEQCRTWADAIDRLAASSEPAGTASAQGKETETLKMLTLLRTARRYIQEAHPWEDELSGRKRLETDQDVRDRHSMAMELNQNRRDCIDELDATIEALAATPSTAAATRVDVPLPTIKGASIEGGYVIVTPAGWGADKAYAVRDAILAALPVDPKFTPKPDSAQTGEAGK